MTNALCLDVQGYKIHATSKDNLPSAETYEDVKNMIYQQCWKAVKRFGGDFDDFLSVANEAFVKAYNTWEPGKSQFITWAHIRVAFAIKSFIEERQKQHERYGANNEQLPNSPEDRDYWVEDFVRDLSDDARTVVKLLVDAPAELKNIVWFKRKKQVIWSYLKNLGLDWTMARAIESFEEIKEALCG